MKIHSATNVFEFAHIAAEIAHEAGALLCDFYGDGVSVTSKGEADLVTVADKASELLIKEKLEAAFPDHGIFGEEGTRVRPNAEYRWHVDPLDGTTNFAHGLPVFCVVLGLEKRGPSVSTEQDGEMIAGVIYDPLRAEMFMTERGKGSWLNGRQIRVSRTVRLQESLTSTGFPSRHRHESPNIYFYQAMNLRTHGVRRGGSGALDMAYVACGRLEAFWEFGLNPWDTSAGYLLVEEAGGTVTRFDGSKFNLDSSEVLVTNGKILREMTELFDTIFAGEETGLISAPAPFRAAARKDDKKLSDQSAVMATQGAGY